MMHSCEYIVSPLVSYITSRRSTLFLGRFVAIRLDDANVCKSVRATCIVRTLHVRFSTRG